MPKFLFEATYTLDGIRGIQQAAAAVDATRSRKSPKLSEGAWRARTSRLVSSTST